MNTVVLSVNLLATACGLIILARAVNIVRHMDVRNRREHYLHWLAFGVSYALLATAAAGALIAIWSGTLEIGYLAWLGASAGLIVFDRRRRPKIEELAGRGPARASGTAR